MSTSLRSIAKQLSIPRAIGTVGHTRVKRLLVHYCRSFGFRVILQPFRRRIGGHVYQFTNVLAVNPYRNRHETPVVLSAHYDGPFRRDQVELEAASDSAVSLAMILTLGKAWLTRRPDRNVMLMFLDGEESLRGIDEWNADVTLSGATVMAASGMIPKEARLIFLDLLGAPASGPILFHVHTSTDVELFRKLCTLCPQHFRCQVNPLRIEDDPLPFRAEGYSHILHLIPWPFSPTHHTEDDRYDSIDWTAVDAIWHALRSSVDVG